MSVSIPALKCLPMHPIVTRSQRFTSLEKRAAAFAIYDKAHMLNYMGYTDNLYKSLKYHFIKYADNTYHYSYLSENTGFAMKHVDLIDNAWTAETGVPFIYEDNDLSFDLQIESCRTYKNYLKALFKERRLNSGYHVMGDDTTITVIF